MSGVTTDKLQCCLSVCLSVCTEAREFSSKAGNLVKGSQEGELVADVQELDRLIEEQEK